MLQFWRYLERDMYCLPKKINWWKCIKATTGYRMLYFEPQVVDLIIFYQGILLMNYPWSKVLGNDILLVLKYQLVPR